MSEVTQFTTTGGILFGSVLFTAGTADFSGTADCVILDADGDTHISAPTDNQIDICVAGADDFTFTSNSFNVLTGSCIAGPSSTTFVPFIPLATFQSLSGAGAINVTTYLTKLTTTGANALTLANGVVKGQQKLIHMVVDGGDGTLTPVSLSGGTTITFADAGDFVLLGWNSTAWVLLQSGNYADGITAPVLA